MSILKDYEQFYNIAKRNAELVETQKKVLGDLEERQKNFLDTCTHNFSLYLGKSYLNGVDEGFTICLECGRSFKLKTKTCERINYDGIIDISNVITDDNLYTMIGSSYIMVLVAQKIMNGLAKEENANGFYTLAGIKQAVIDGIIEFNQNMTDDTIKNFDNENKNYSRERTIAFPKK
ncbi:MAG: hypothetical protein IJO33_03000 [Bacilli bacterium]|nr:hypothetical protein [Bacilli bacterium]